MAFQLPDYSKMLSGGPIRPMDPISFDQPGIPTFDASGLKPFSPSALSVAAPQGQTPGWFGIDGFGKNMETLKGFGTGLQTLAGLWSSIQALKMAKKQYSLTRDTTNANLANQTQSYNTSIEDKARSRAAWEGQNQAQVADYITKNSLPKRSV